MTKPLILLIGGGGHCRSVIDVLEQENKYQIAGIIDFNIGDKILGYEVIGSDEELPKLRNTYEYAVITVGQIRSPAIREKLYKVLKELHFNLPNIVSPAAYLSRHVTIGEGNVFMHGSIVNASAKIGNGCIVNSRALIEHDAEIENFCHISTGAIINGGVSIQHGTFVGSGAVSQQGAESERYDFIKANSVLKGKK